MSVGVHERWLLRERCILCYTHLYICPLGQIEEVGTPASGD